MGGGLVQGDKVVTASGGRGTVMSRANGYYKLLLKDKTITYSRIQQLRDSCECASAFFFSLPFAAFRCLSLRFHSADCAVFSVGRSLMTAVAPHPKRWSSFLIYLHAISLVAF